MWQVYQYGQGKLKLTKDLKTAESHLRVSLIDQEEIENMAKIYKDRKNYYKINAQSYTAPSFVEQSNVEETTAHLSYKEKVQLYRRRVQNEKLDNKYNSLFKKAEKKRHKMRNPIIYKLLQHFEEEYKHQDNLQIREHFKESEKNLEMIKINTNRKAKFEEPTIQEGAPNRPRFISLENSKPEKERLTLPTWKEYLQRKITKTNNAASGISVPELNKNMKSIYDTGKSEEGSQKKQQEVQSDKIQENSEDISFFCEHCKKDINIHKKEDGKHENRLHRNLSSNKPNQARKTMRGEFKRKQGERDQKQFHRNLSMHETNQARKIVTRQSKRKQADKDSINFRRILSSNQANSARRAMKEQSKRNRLKPEQIIEHSFNYSEKSCKKVISTMENFYQTKSHKKEDYESMVFYLKKDRPLTSNIRRTNYRVISTGNIQQINKYRNLSEKERLNLKNRNQEFYMSLLKQLQSYSTEELSLTGKIMDKLRAVLAKDYIFNPRHLQQISQPALYQKRDEFSDSLLEQCSLFMEKHYR